MNSQERRAAQRVPLNSGGCAIINGDNIDIKTHGVSKTGALIEFIPPIPIKEGTKFRAHLNIGFIGRAKICRTEVRDDCTLYGITFERFEFGSDRMLIENFAKNDEALSKSAAASGNKDAVENIFRVRECHQTKVVFKEGAVGDSAYIVKSGRVCISKLVDGQKIVVTELGPGTIFGELALLTRERRRSATVEAVEKTELIEISNEQFDQLVEKSPTVIISILHALGKRVVELTAAIVRREILLRRLQNPK
jgi:hypothetical protein